MAIERPMPDPDGLTERQHLAAPATRFCTTCGEPLDGDSCSHEIARRPSTSGPADAPTKAATHVPAVAAGGNRTRFLLLTLAVALAVVAALVVGALSWSTAANTNDELRALRRQVEASQRDLAATARDVKDRDTRSAAATRQLSVRVGTLEAKAKNSADPAALAKATSPSVFTVETRSGLGSGWVAASSDGHSQLVTNFHVISDVYVNGGRAVSIRQGDRTYPATITSTSAADDLAVLSVGVKLPALSVDRAEPASGESVLVVGSPIGLGGSVSSGIVSAVRTEEGVRYIQFTAPISPGNSGGPVVNRHGKVIGVSVAKIVGGGAEGLSFAVPAARVCADFDVC
jgi:S1-C subfamily serine protease